VYINVNARGTKIRCVWRRTYMDLNSKLNVLSLTSLPSVVLSKGLGSTIENTSTIPWETFCYCLYIERGYLEDSQRALVASEPRPTSGDGIPKVAKNSAGYSLVLI